MSGTMERLLNGDEDIEQCLRIRIDYDAVHARIHAARQASYDYLRAALRDEGSTDL